MIICRKCHEFIMGTKEEKHLYQFFKNDIKTLSKIQPVYFHYCEKDGKQLNIKEMFKCFEDNLKTLRSTSICKTCSYYYSGSSHYKCSSPNLTPGKHCDYFTFAEDDLYKMLYSEDKYFIDKPSISLNKYDEFISNFYTNYKIYDLEFDKKLYRK